MTQRAVGADAVIGLLSGLTAVAMMAAVAALGLHLVVADASGGARLRLSAAAVSLAVGASAEVAASGAVVGEGEQKRLPGGLTMTATGRAGVRPLGVLLAGAVVLFVLVRRRPSLGRAAGAVTGFVTAVAVCAGAARPVAVPAGPVTLTLVPDRPDAVLGGLLCALVFVGAGLAVARGGPRWRRPVVAVTAVVGGLAAIGTVAGTLAGAVAGGGRAAGVGLLAGANVLLGALSWALGVPWRLAVRGRLGEVLRERQPAGWDGDRPWWLILAAVLLVVLGGLLSAGRGRYAAARLSVVAGAAVALVTAATGLSGSAAVGLSFLRVPVLDLTVRGDVPAAVLVGALAGLLGGLLAGAARWIAAAAPRPALSRSGVRPPLE